MSNPSLYRRLVDSLIYHTVTCPNISYVVYQVSQYLSTPRSTHYAAVLCILRYLKGTLKLFSISSKDQLTDTFTKSLPKGRTRDLVDNLKLVSHPP